MKEVVIRLVKGSDGSISEVVFDWNGYRGKECVRRAEELMEKLKGLGVKVKELNREYKGEYYLEEEVESREEIEL